MDLVADHERLVPGHDLREFDECLPAVHQADRVVGAAPQYTSGSGGKGAVDPVQVEGGGVTVVQQRIVHDAGAAFGNKVVEGWIDRWCDDDPGAGWEEMTQRLHDDHTDIGGAPHPSGGGGPSPGRAGVGGEGFDGTAVTRIHITGVSEVEGLLQGVLDR